MTDPCPADVEMPASAWSPEVAFRAVEERIASDSPAIRRRGHPIPRRGGLAAAAAFVAVLVVGGLLFATLGDRSATDPVAPATTTPPSPATTVPPPSTRGDSLSPEIRTLFADLEAAYNSSDVEALTPLTTPQASLVPSPSGDRDGSIPPVLLVDQVATADLFEETIRFGACTQHAAEIRCEVTVTDRFAAALQLEPSVQAWSIEVDAGRVERITASGENPARVIAMAEFEQYVFEQDPTAPPLLAGTHAWNRTPAVSRAVATQVVGFGAQRNGVPAEAWNVIARFYSALRDGDVGAAEALFIPGGEYVSTDAEDSLSSSIGPESRVVGSSDLRSYFTWWYTMLQMDLVPRVCSGTATSVTCRSESRGIAVLYLPGGAATGTVEFTLEADGIALVKDRIRRSSGTSGIGGTTSPFDLRGFWRTWMPQNAPELEALWPDGNGNPPGGFTAEFARVIIELYPRYLAASGVDVPSQYLDGSLLANL